MSHRTRTHKVIVAALGLTAAVLIAGCDPATGRTPATDTSDPAVPTEVSIWGDTTYEGEPVVFSANCDDTGFAYNVSPNTPLAHKAARRACDFHAQEVAR